MKDHRQLIPISPLLNEPVGTIHNLSIKLKFSDIDEVNFIKEISAQVKLTNIDENLMADIETTGQIQLICSRCAKPFLQNINLNFNYDVDLHDSETVLHTKNGLELDISKAVFDEILINIPIKRLCRPQCKGVLYGRTKKTSH